MVYKYHLKQYIFYARIKTSCNKQQYYMRNLEVCHSCDRSSNKYPLLKREYKYPCDEYHKIITWKFGKETKHIFKKMNIWHTQNYALCK